MPGNRARSRSSSRDVTPSQDKQWQDISSSQWRAKSRSVSPMLRARNLTPRKLNSYLEQFSRNRIRNDSFADMFDTSKQQVDHHTTMTNSLQAQPKPPKPFKAATRWNEPGNESMVHGTTNRLLDEECSKSERMRQQGSVSPMRSRAASGQQEIGTARGISQASSEPPWGTDILLGGGYDQIPKAIPIKAMGVPSAFVATASKQRTSSSAKNQLSEGWFGWSSTNISPRKMSAPHCKAQSCAHARKYDHEMVRVGSWVKTLRR